ncbi:50S ribosomal protein L10 [Listeria monocytogenes]|nr:50S ribosomal protein L10 [Listeria monocytogenes]GAT42187.1 50S ribosomal protein L10 [Listeria monocytogenes]
MFPFFNGKYLPELLLANLVACCWKVTSLTFISLTFLLPLCLMGFSFILSHYNIA